LRQPYCRRRLIERAPTPSAGLPPFLHER